MRYLSLVPQILFSYKEDMTGVQRLQTDLLLHEGFIRVLIYNSRNKMDIKTHITP